jgi:cytidylate kinase
MNSEKFVINIGRQYGAGGLKAAEILSKSLGINYYDKNLIKIAAKKSGFCKEFFENMDEKKASGFAGDLSGLLTSVFGGGYYGDNLLLNESLFKIQSDIIKQLARKEPCIFVGRCADYILRENPKSINVFICADIEDRIKSVCEEQKEGIETAREKIEKNDKQRAKYYNFYSNKIWGAASSYHLCLNSSVLGIEKTAEIIQAFAEKKLGI